MDTFDKLNQKITTDLDQIDEEELVSSNKKSISIIAQLAPTILHISIENGIIPGHKAIWWHNKKLQSIIEAIKEIKWIIKTGNKFEQRISLINIGLIFTVMDAIRNTLSDKTKLQNISKKLKAAGSPYNTLQEMIDAGNLSFIYIFFY